MDPEKRLRLIQRWSDWFYAHTDTRGGPLGMELAYLFTAMAKDPSVELKANTALVRILRRESVSLSDPIWWFIAVT